MTKRDMQNSKGRLIFVLIVVLTERMIEREKVTLKRPGLICYLPSLCLHATLELRFCAQLIYC